MSKKKNAFVIMSFKSELDSVYFQSIEPAFKECGYNCVRAKEDRRQVNVPNQIIKSIISADIVLADISENSPNVFYELGVSHSVGNKTITITSNVQDVPFDLRSYQVIEYNTKERRGHELLKIDIINTIRIIEEQKKLTDSQKVVPNNLVQEAGREYFDLRKKIEERLKQLNAEIERTKKFNKFIETYFLNEGVEGKVDNSPVARKIVEHINAVRRLSPGRPIIISICGSGAIGKSSFAEKVLKIIEESLKLSVAILPTDSYMLSRADRIERNLLGFDPRANDLEQFFQDVGDLLERKAIEISPYNHKTGEHEKEVPVNPGEIIILEGIYSFFPEINNLCQNLDAKQLKYFIYADKYKAKELKFISDIKERGHSIHKALQHAVPEYSAYETYILPHIKLADYIIRVDGYWKFNLPEKQKVDSLYER